MTDERDALVVDDASRGRLTPPAITRTVDSTRRSSSGTDSTRKSPSGTDSIRRLASRHRVHDEPMQQSEVPFSLQ